MIDETLKDIKKELRANMNGILSAKMREAGMPYKLVFGVEQPRLQVIAREFAPDHQLAQRLWHENIRECKLLAALLMPVESFYPEIADIWVEEIPTDEVAQFLSMHLLSRLPYAASLAFEWIASDHAMRQFCGYLTLARILMRGAQLNPRSVEELQDQMQAALPHAPLALRKVFQTIEAKLSEQNITS